MTVICLTEVTLTCLSHWTSGSKLNVIAQLYDIEENKMPANCFVSTKKH